MEFFDFFEKVLIFIVFVQNCLGCVPRPEKCEKLSKKFENRLILAHFVQIWPILATFYEFKSRFEKSW
jgi:hypothetical protein